MAEPRPSAEVFAPLSLRREPKLLHTPLLQYIKMSIAGGGNEEPPHDPKAKPPAYTWGVTHSSDFTLGNPRIQP